MVYCAVVGCYNHSNTKNTTEKTSYSVYHLMKAIVGRGWIKLGGKTSKQITIAFVFAIYISKISFNTI